MLSTMGASPRAVTAPVRWSQHRSCRPASPPPRPKAPLVPYFPRLGPGSNRQGRQHARGQPAAAGRGQSSSAAVGAGRHLPRLQPSTQQALCCPATAAAVCKDPPLDRECYRQEKQAFPDRGARILGCSSCSCCRQRQRRRRRQRQQQRRRHEVLPTIRRSQLPRWHRCWP